MATLHPDGQISQGTVTRAIATCPWPDCGRTTKGYLASEAQAGRMGHQLYCVVYRDSWKDKTKSGRPKKRDTSFRGFAEVNPDRDNSPWITEQLAERAKRWEQDDILPSEDLQFGNKTKEPVNYGVPKWGKMFSPTSTIGSRDLYRKPSKDLVEEDRQADELDEIRKVAWGVRGTGFRQNDQSEQSINQMGCWIE